VAQSQLLAQRGGPLVVEPTVDGPLHVRGNLEVVSGTGKTINRITEGWLCRCGHSRNKPYCDGSHKAAGFRSAT
jgi:CDGSH-type Zn-finger protein